MPIQGPSFCGVRLRAYPLGQLASWKLQNVRRSRSADATQALPVHESSARMPRSVLDRSDASPGRQWARLSAIFSFSIPTSRRASGPARGQRQAGGAQTGVLPVAQRVFLALSPVHALAMRMIDGSLIAASPKPWSHRFRYVPSCVSRPKQTLRPNSAFAKLCESFAEERAPTLETHICKCQRLHTCPSGSCRMGALNH